MSVEEQVPLGRRMAVLSCSSRKDDILARNDQLGNREHGTAKQNRRIASL